MALTVSHRLHHAPATWVHHQYNRNGVKSRLDGNVMCYQIIAVLVQTRYSIWFGTTSTLRRPHSGRKQILPNRIGHICIRATLAVDKPPNSSIELDGVLSTFVKMWGFQMLLRIASGGCLTSYENWSDVKQTLQVMKAQEERSLPLCTPSNSNLWSEKLPVGLRLVSTLLPQQKWNTDYKWHCKVQIISL